MLIKKITKDFGGDVSDILNLLDFREFVCSCGRKQTLNSFLGYEHSDGLMDKDNNKWWVYYECVKCGYQWSVWKLLKRLNNGGGQN